MAHEAMVTGRLGVTSLTRPDTSEHGEAPADGTECARLANARRRRVRQKATKAFYRQTVTEGADGGSRGGKASEVGKHSPECSDQSRRGRFIEELAIQHDSTLAALTARVGDLERCVQDTLMAAMQRVDERFSENVSVRVQAQERTEEEDLYGLREDVVEATEVEEADCARLFEIGTQLAELQRSVDAMKERAAARALGTMQFEEAAEEGAEVESYDDDAETSSVGSSVPEAVDLRAMEVALETVSENSADDVSEEEEELKRRAADGWVKEYAFPGSTTFRWVREDELAGRDARYLAAHGLIRLESGKCARKDGIESPAEKMQGQWDRSELATQLPLKVFVRKKKQRVKTHNRA